MAEIRKIVYLMRGLPSCGKSFTAQHLAGDCGRVFETDAYFHTQVGTNPARYEYDERLLAAARQWNFERFCRAVEAGASPIVVDRGNGLNHQSQQYARFAVDHGYRVQLVEPDSPWWQEIRLLLKNKQDSRALLDEWALMLARRSLATHRVPSTTIRRWMDKWISDLTIEQILNYRS